MPLYSSESILYRRLAGSIVTELHAPTLSRTNVNMLITVFGGSGFLGRHIVRALCKQRHRVRVAVRRPELAGHLQPLGRVGQIHAVQANLRYRDSIESAVRDAHVVIN